MTRDPVRFSVDLVKVAGRSRYLARLSRTARRRVLKRYMDFWRLTSAPDGQTGPDTDIDRMWHLHMQFEAKYKKDCLRYFGYILEHNADFGRHGERDELERIYRKTAELWENKFGVSYSLAEGAGPSECYGFLKAIPEQSDGALRLCCVVPRSRPARYGSVETGAEGRTPARCASECILFLDRCEGLHDQREAAEGLEVPRQYPGITVPAADLGVAT